MRLSRFSAAIASLSLLAACGKSDTPPPAPNPAVTPTVNPETPTPPADAATPAIVEPAPEPAPAVPTGPAYVVWIATANGHESTWIAPQEGGYAAVATQPQISVFADETLWGVERPLTSYREISCDEFENETDDMPAKPSGPVHVVEHLAIRGLAGAEVGKARPMVERLPDYFQKDPDAKGVYTIIGELWGRQLSVDGGAGDLMLIVDCASAFSCGAHGDATCQFVPFTFGDTTVKPNLPAATQALSGAVKGLVKSWTAEAEGEELGAPTVEAVSMRFANGVPAAEYLFVADVSYVATDGDWSSYTQSRNYKAPIIPELALPEVPAEVVAWLAGQTVTTSYGWSAVPVDADSAILAAFKDAATVPAPRPPASAIDPTSPAVDAAGMVKRGRELTRDNKLDDAISTFTTAIELDAKMARAWSGRGYARLRAGDLEGSAADFKQALTLDDSAKFQGAVYFNLGELAEKQGDGTAAVKHYENGNKLAPSAAALKRIEAITTK